MRGRIRAELAKVITVASPVIVTNFLGFGMNLTDQVFVGHLSKEALATAAVSNLLFNLPFFFVIGYTTALDTLGAQAYGRGSKDSLKAWSFTAGLQLSILCVPTILVLLCGEFISFHLLGQSAEIAEAIGSFCALLTPGVWPMAMFWIMQKYLQVQNILWAPAAIAGVANLFNILGNAAFIHWLGLGVNGAPLATSTSRLFQSVVLWAYIIVFHREPKVLDRADLGTASEGNSEAEEREEEGEEGSPTDDSPVDAGDVALRELVVTTPGVDVERGASKDAACAKTVSLSGEAAADGVFASTGPCSAATAFLARFLFPLVAPVVWARRRPDWLTHTANRTFIRLGVAGGLMLGFEAWSFEVTTAMAAPLGTVALDAHVAQLSLAGFSYVTVPLGVAIASTIRVGNLVGAGEAAQARLSSRLSLALASTFQLSIALAMVLLRHQLGSIFSNDAAVQAMVARLAPLCAIFQVTDAFQGVSAGIFRGIGRQTLIAGVNAIGFWVVGIPAGAALAFAAGAGLEGLWYGINIGLVATCLIFVVMLLRIDWEGECVRAVKLSDASTPRSIDDDGTRVELIEHKRQCGDEQGTEDSSAGS